MLVVPLALGAWLWFGAAGALLLGLWWWLQRPRDHPHTKPQPWRIDLARVHGARLGTWRTCIGLRGHDALEVFHDEISAADLAFLRRTLIRQLAAG